MRDYTSIGLLVSKISTLFPLVKQIGMQVGFKSWKIWEDRPENIDNIPKNDIIVLEDDPVEGATASALTSYVKSGGILVYLFSLEDEGGFEDVIVDGRLAGDAYKSLLEGVDEEDFASRCKGLVVKISRGDDGVVVSFSRNVFTHELDPEAGRGEETVDNFDFFVNVMKYLAGLKAGMDAKKADAVRAPASKVAVMIHGAALWSGDGEPPIESLLKQVFNHLGIDDLFPQVLKERLYRSIDPDQQDTFPEVYYYHSSFADDEEDKRPRLATAYLEQAKAVHAIIRTERFWEQDATPLFFLDLARYHTEIQGLARLYLLPPARVGTKTRETTTKLLSRCFLEPLATKGVESFTLTAAGKPGGVVPCFADIKKVKARPTEETKALVILHGPELAAGIKDKPISDFLGELDAKVGGTGDTLKILVHIAVDLRGLQDRIKEMTINARKVESKQRERIKKDIERAQEKLHACTRIEKDKKIFEDRGFTVIEIEDSIDADQDAKEFFVDQVLPFIIGRKISRVHELLPAGLEAYLKTVSSPLIPPDDVKRIPVT
ncbi:MAG: hypothetical protein JW839_12465 [Candidatus Lokiarchaeota archaeon]|nr:hypothetical protein [Candidatus Lokiarchaeota archaeon]